jgi:hypothetical protein
MSWLYPRRENNFPAAYKTVSKIKEKFEGQQIAARWPGGLVTFYNIMDLHSIFDPID